MKHKTHAVGFEPFTFVPVPQLSSYVYLLVCALRICVFPCIPEGVSASVCEYLPV